MNMKQKLTYMLIGCLFTLAGYALSSLFNTPTHVQAQDEKVTVFDKIVCKKLEIVNDGGQTMVELTNIIGGTLHLYNRHGKMTVGVGQNLKGAGSMNVYNKNGKLAAELGTALSLSGELTLYQGIKEQDVGPSVLVSPIGVYIDNDDGSTVTELGIDGLRIYNEDGMKYEKDGESVVLKNKLVVIGKVDGRPNDGLINIYNHKGEWRSFSAD